MISWIQNWFNEQCDGDWEHDQTIKIESLDNPGWSVEIDFNYTDVDKEDIAWKVYESAENNWIGYRISDNVFIASGDPLKLNSILEIFKRITENGDLSDEYLNSLVSLENKN